MNSQIVTQVVEQLSRLPNHLQQRVLDFVQALTRSSQQRVSGRQLLRFAGAIPLDDLHLMQSVIEAGCEQVDTDEW